MSRTKSRPHAGTGAENGREIVLRICMARGGILAPARRQKGIPNAKH
ncbi:MAG: hypothetical protein IJZ37_02945 [Clostridia bacterium]|nr:hypothetical protein [Clostridia bacterium]